MTPSYATDHMGTSQTAPSPSPQAWWMCRILSTDLHTPLQDQSNDATHMFPARFFHSQSVVDPEEKDQKKR
jgi:hypothetical protein